MAQVFHLEELKTQAEELGLVLVGYSGISAPSESKRSLKIWQESGYAGSMSYMNREVELLSDAKRLLPSAKSVLMFALPYSSSPHPSLKKGYARVARYAWGRDYHIVMRKRLERFITSFQTSDTEARVFSDSVPLLERAFGKVAGLGFVGKNTLLIRPKTGSFFFLGEIVWNQEVKGDFQTYNDSCGTCSKCLSNCPTNAFPKPYVLDATKCISYLTIEKRGLLSVQERAAIGEWLFGCDICQDVCPFNHTSIKEKRSGDEEFGIEMGIGPLVNLEELLSIRSDEEFKKVYANTPLLRPKREGLIRNGICVAVNTETKELLPSIRECLRDNSEIVREHAKWAVEILDSFTR